MVFPIVAHPDSRDHDLNKLESSLYKKVFFHLNMSSFGSVVCEKIFK
jgi:hypothetical protein